MEFKRNQIGDAILRTLDATDARADTLKLRMKRLLVTDRRLGRGKLSDNSADRGYAFYSQSPQDRALKFCSPVLRPLRY